MVNFEIKSVKAKKKTFQNIKILLSKSHKYKLSKNEIRNLILLLNFMF